MSRSKQGILWKTKVGLGPRWPCPWRTSCIYRSLAAVWLFKNFFQLWVLSCEQPPTTHIDTFMCCTRSDSYRICTTSLLSGFVALHIDCFHTPALLPPFTNTLHVIARYLFVTPVDYCFTQPCTSILESSQHGYVHDMAQECLNHWWMSLVSSFSLSPHRAVFTGFPLFPPPLPIRSPIGSTLTVHSY